MKKFSGILVHFPGTQLEIGFSIFCLLACLTERPRNQNLNIYWILGYFAQNTLKNPKLSLYSPKSNSSNSIWGKIPNKPQKDSS
jgi:hypothetical protein